MNNDLCLYQKIQNDIRELIKDGTLSYQEKVPSVNDIKQKYNVSHITVMRVLKDLANENYISFVKGKGYFVSYNGKPHAVQNTGYIAVIMRPLRETTFHDNYFNEINCGIQCAAYKAKLNLIQPVSNMFLENYILSEYEKAEIKNSILTLADKVDGFILDERIPDSIIKECMEKISKPMVVVNRVSSLDIPAVVCDNRFGSEKAAETALKMGYNHFVICEPDSKEKNPNTLSRIKFFREVLKKNGISSIDTITDCNFNPYLETYSKVQEICKNKGALKSKVLVFALAPKLARDLVDSFTEKGVSFGDKLGVVCFESTGYATLRKPYISSVTINCYDIGAAAVEVISSAMLSNYSEHKKEYIINVLFQMGDTL